MKMSNLNLAFFSRCGTR